MSIPSLESQKITKKPQNNIKKIQFLGAVCLSFTNTRWQDWRTWEIPWSHGPKRERKIGNSDNFNIYTQSFGHLERLQESQTHCAEPKVEASKQASLVLSFQGA